MTIEVSRRGGGAVGNGHPGGDNGEEARREKVGQTTAQVVDRCEQKKRITVNRISAITPLAFLPISRSRELKLTKLVVLLNTLAQWCTSWCQHLRSWVRTKCINPKGHRVPGDCCACQGSSPLLGVTPAACFWLFFLWL